MDFTASIERPVTGLDLRLSDEATGLELSVTGGVEASLGATLQFSVEEDGTGEVWLVHDSTTPTPLLDVSVAAELSADAQAAIGILGVQLTNSSLAISHHTVVTMNDPNNDGRLAFAGNDAELAAAGSLEGLVQAVLDETDGGSVSGEFTIGADTSMPIPGFPTTIDATVEIDWPDITVGTPSVSTTGFDATLGKFQNMNLQNLADGLARTITAINAIQQRTYDDGGVPTGNLDLPFMRGTLADAIQIAEPLRLFLADNIWSGAVDELMGAAAPDGQDDIIGGSSIRGFRDGGDVIEANGAHDVVLGDNGTLLRSILGGAGAYKRGCLHRALSHRCGAGRRRPDPDGRSGLRRADHQVLHRRRNHL